MERLIPLVASILLSTGLFAVFKFIGKKGLPQFPVIIINYITCFVLGNLVLGDQHILRFKTVSTEGFWPLLCLGMLFVGTFFLMAKSTHDSGAAASSMASKMSMIIPIIASVLFWGEAVSVQMIVGILLAVASVYMISRVKSDNLDSQYSTKILGKNSEKGSNSESNILLNSKQISHPQKSFNVILILVFLGSGMVDTLLNVFKQLNYNDFNNEQKAALTFGGAMISGLLVWAVKPRSPDSVVDSKHVMTEEGNFSVHNSVKNGIHFDKNHVASNHQESNFESSTPVGEPMHLNTPTNSNVLTIVSGIVLGSINFYSVVALYAAIDAFKENTAILFSLNNVGVVVLSTIVGWFFGERPVARVFWGMGLAILSILVLAF